MCFAAGRIRAGPVDPEPCHFKPCPCKPFPWNPCLQHPLPIPTVSHKAPKHILHLRNSRLPPPFNAKPLASPTESIFNTCIAGSRPSRSPYLSLLKPPFRRQAEVFFTFKIQIPPSGGTNFLVYMTMVETFSTASRPHRKHHPSYSTHQIEKALPIKNHMGTIRTASRQHRENHASCSAPENKTTSHSTTTSIHATPHRGRT